MNRLLRSDQNLMLSSCPALTPETFVLSEFILVVEGSPLLFRSPFLERGQGMLTGIGPGADQPGHRMIERPVHLRPAGTADSSERLTAVALEAVFVAGSPALGTLKRITRHGEF